MSESVVLYLLLHQPRRLRLPAQPIPRGASVEEIARSLFDDDLDRSYFERVAERSYRPTLELLDQLVREEGLRLSIGLSLSWLRQADRWDPGVVERLAGLLRLPGVELVGCEPYHSLLPYLDVTRFTRSMRAMGRELGRRFGQPVRVTDTTEMLVSNDIYYAVARAGFRAMFMDGRHWVLGDRSPGFVYRHGSGSLRLLVRHHALSDDVGYRFSDRTWPGWPLMADAYAAWVADTPGPVTVLGWDFETFGEHHEASTGIFDFLASLAQGFRERQVESRTPSDVLGRYGSAAELTLPAHVCTWAGSGGIEFFLGNQVQQAVFRLMHHAYNKAILTGDPALVDLALWLMQSDHLHLLQWWGASGAEAQVSAYFTPQEWWRLGPDRIVVEVQRVYENFVQALDGAVERGTAKRRKTSRPPVAPALPAVHP